MKKKMPLFLLPLLCLTACGDAKLTGTYCFKMGKDQETHIGLFVDLTEEDYKVGDTVKGKKLKLDIELPDTMDITTFTLIKEILDNGVSTYYNIDKSVVVNGMTKVNLSADIINDLDPTATVTVPEKIFNYAILVFVDGKTLSATLPVSMADLQHQLAWYGELINMETLEFTSLDTHLLPGFTKIEERFGTHPKVDKVKDINQVSEMNFVFQYDFSSMKVFETDKTTKYGFISSEELVPNGLFTETVYYMNTVDGVRISTSGEKDVYINGVNYKLEADEKGKIVNFKDSSGTKLDLDNIFKQPYVFRDYHALSIGLMKE